MQRIFLFLTLFLSFSLCAKENRLWCPPPTENVAALAVFENASPLLFREPEAYPQLIGRAPVILKREGEQMERERGMGRALVGIQVTDGGYLGRSLLRRLYVDLRIFIRGYGSYTGLYPYAEIIFGPGEYPQLTLILDQTSVLNIESNVGRVRYRAGQPFDIYARSQRPFAHGDFRWESNNF